MCEKMYLLLNLPHERGIAWILHWWHKRGVGIGRGCPPSQPYRPSKERRELPQRGPGQSPGRQRIFGIFDAHRTLLVERTVLLHEGWGRERWWGKVGWVGVLVITSLPASHSVSAMIASCTASLQHFYGRCGRYLTWLSSYRLLCKDSFLCVPGQNLGREFLFPGPQRLWIHA